MMRTPLVFMSVAALAVGAGCERSSASQTAGQEVAATELNLRKVEPAVPQGEREPSRRVGRHLEKPAELVAAVPSRQALTLRADPIPAVTLKGTVEAEGFEADRVVVYLATTPCAEQAGPAAPLGQTTLSFGKTQPFTLSGQSPTNGAAHVCAVALDAKDQVVAQGGWAKNPVDVKSGQQTAVVTDAKVTLERLKAPRALPKGWLK